MTLRSMTGFGAAEAEHGPVSFSVVARSVNHRFLDLSIKLPPELRSIEHELRGVAKDKLARGRLELVIELRNIDGASASRLNAQAVSDLVQFATELESDGLVSGQLRAIDVLRFPGVVEESKFDATSSELRATIMSTVEEALDVLVVAREQEGSALSKKLTEVAQELDGCLATIRDLATARRSDLVRRSRERLLSLIGPVAGTDDDAQTINFDENRLLQEAGLLAERLDVSEEVERLEVHLNTVRSVLKAGGVCGKRLDFLAQEVLREINTIASKCRDADLTSAAVDAKVLCERFREQVQNVE